MSRVAAVVLVYGNVLVCMAIALVSVMICFSLNEELLNEMENQVERMEENVSASRLELAIVHDEIRRLLIQSKR